MRANVRLDTKKLDALLNGAGIKAEKVLDKAARDVEAGWKDNIVQKNVVDTGAYLNSVHVEASHPPLERTIADGVEYGIYQEYGTKRFPARPCATPAVERIRAGLRDAFKAVFK